MYGDNATSVAHWVDEMEHENFNSVLYHKTQEEEQNEKGVEKSDFLLAIQTEFQKKCLTSMDLI